jgi:hypothetical protein
MPKTDTNDALADLVAADDYDPKSFVDGEPLRRVVAASDELDRAREHLHHEVTAAHESGLSWTVIGATLGISRQAARQRFG